MLQQPEVSLLDRHGALLFSLAGSSAASPGYADAKSCRCARIVAFLICSDNVSKARPPHRRRLPISCSAASLRCENICAAETCRGAAAPRRSGGGSLPTSSPSFAHSDRENAAHFHTARVRDSRRGTSPCAKPNPVRRALLVPPRQNPPPTRSAVGECPAATRTCRYPSSSTPRPRAWSLARPARRDTLPSTHQMPAPV